MIRTHIWGVQGECFHLCADRNPEIVHPHIVNLIAKLEEEPHVAVKRNIVRVLQDQEIEEDLMGSLADVCFRYLQSAAEPAAVKVFSMTILLHIVVKFPELKEELQFCIEEQMPFGSPGFCNRGKKTLDALAKLR